MYSSWFLMKRSSRCVQFVNNNLPEDRVFLLKPSPILQSIDDNDENIAQTNIITKYDNRPKTLENISLAEYVAWYNDRPKCTVHRRYSVKLSKFQIQNHMIMIVKMTIQIILKRII